MRKRYCLFLLVLLMAGCGASVTEEDVEVPGLQEGALPVSGQTRTVSPIGRDDPVTRALATKMLAAAYNDLNAIAAMDRIISFTDTEPGMWYDRYINAAYTAGLMSGGDGIFSPEGFVTLSQAQTIADRLDPQGRIQLNITEETKNDPISYALWLDLYMRLLDELSGDKTVAEVFGVQERSLVVLATAANNSQLNQWSVVTDRGAFSCMGLNLDPYIDKEIRVLLKDGDILAVLSVDSVSPKIANAYVTHVGEGLISIFSGGAERSYSYSGASVQAGDICDIVISDGQAQSVTPITERVRDEILLTNTGRIEFRELPALEIGADFKVYDATGRYVRWRGRRDLVVGTSGADIFIRDGTAAAAVIRESADPTSLRVAINTSGYSGLYHENVSLSATTAFTVNAGGQETRYEPWTEFKVAGEMFADSQRIFISADDGGRIVLNTVGRAWPNGENPKYRGDIEIYKSENGYVIVNIVSMEEYLYAVIPSEMPSSYGVEASKAQAITARSYAYNQFFANRFHTYGANIDDSVSSQVYNNIPENEVSIQATNETRGQVLTYNSEVVSANFFSTSSGHTANSGEVWAHSVTKMFPTATPEYLSSKRQFEGADYGDLTDEEAAARFFKDLSIEAFDSNVSWFRWNVDMTAQEIAAAINSGLRGRYAANPQLIKTLQSDGVYRSVPVETIGALKDLEILRRGQGGNIMEMRIVGTEAELLLRTEYNIRALIKPVQLTGGEPIILRRKDGTDLSNYSIMPSAFYTIDKTYNDNGELDSVRFTGGGNGHGAGMSQNGVRGMLERGFNITEILQHFYSGTEITQMY